jgi:hypothetical protein
MAGGSKALKLFMIQLWIVQSMIQPTVINVRRTNTEDSEYCLRLALSDWLCYHISASLYLRKDYASV